MSSPAPGEVMGITNMLNQKGVASAAMQSGHPTPGQMPEQSMAHQLPPVSLDRADSPHGSEHSRYSQPPMNGNLQSGRTYGSPTAMHAPLHMPEPNMAPSGMAFPAMAPDMQYASQPVRAPDVAPQPAPKAYQCSTCQKGFARRSDLARHGSCSIILFHEQFIDLRYRTNSHRGATSCLRLSQLWQTIHPAVCSDRTSARPHWREAAYVRTLWKGVFPSY